MDITKAIKKACLAVMGAGTSLVIAACYGPYMAMENMGVVSGRVTNGGGQGVPGLQICARVPGYSSECTVTDSYGNFQVNGQETFRENADLEGFWLTVEDVDGSANGLYDDAQVAVDSGSVPADVDVTVEEMPQ